MGEDYSNSGILETPIRHSDNGIYALFAGVYISPL